MPIVGARCRGIDASYYVLELDVGGMDWSLSRGVMEYL